MKILITGATGLVGSALVTLCRQQGIAINYLTTSKNKIVKEPDYQGFHWNPSAGEIEEEAFHGVTAIVHLAGATIAQRWTDQNKKSIKDSRIKSARLMYEVLERFRESKTPTTITHLISASAIGCYPSSQTKYYDESYTSYASGFLGEVVEEWEKEILEFEKLDIKTSLLRTGIILDKKEGALPKIITPIKMYAGAALGTGEQWQSWIHIQDMAALYLYVLQHQLTGVFNAVSPNPVTNAKLTKAIAAAIKRPLFLPNIPAAVLKLMLGDMAAIVLQSQKVAAQKIQDTGFKFTYPTIEKAIEDLV